MALKSYLFQGNERLEQCLVSHPAHVVPGDYGPHVHDIQVALEYLDDLVISPDEKAQMLYGPSTAAAVLAYKKKRKIINRSYQTTEDNIVGIMTMRRLDEDMCEQEQPVRKQTHFVCRRCGSGMPIASSNPIAKVDPMVLANQWRGKIKWNSV